MSETYSKADLVQDLAAQFDVPKAKARDIADFVTDTIVKKAKKGHKVSINGFGTFTLRKRAARAGRNPRTGETVKIKASKSLAFKQSKTVKDAL